MVKLSITAKNMIFVVCVLVLVFIMASAVYYIFFTDEGPLAFLPFAVGAVMGGGANVVRIFLLDRLVARTTEEVNFGVTKNTFILQYFLRYLLIVLVLLIAVLVPFISLWGAAAGVITFPLSAHVMLLFKQRE